MQTNTMFLYQLSYYWVHPDNQSESENNKWIDLVMQFLLPWLHLTLIWKHEDLRLWPGHGEVTSSLAYHYTSLLNLESWLDVTSTE